MNKWIAEFELEDGDKMPEHMDLEYKGAKIDFHCKPLEQEPTTKNNLGVDAVSRQAVIDLMMQKWGENFSGDDAMQESIDAIREMPSVTPQEPRKGHWIIDTHKIRTFGSKNVTHDYSVHCDK